MSPPTADPPGTIPYPQFPAANTTQVEVWNALTAVSQGIYGNLDSQLRPMQSDIGNLTQGVNQLKT